MGKGTVVAAAAVAAAVVAVSLGRRYGGWAAGGEALVGFFRELAGRLGLWAIPAYVLAHTVTLALCLPYAVVFEAGAPLLFGFLPAVLCVFAAKILGASLSFWIGRAVFRGSKSAMEWAQRSRYFHLLARGVEKDGWRFVLLARFSPLPSYVINYALAATEVGFFVDFLLPTVIGCVPMILQNTSIGSLAGAAVSASSGSEKSHIYSYLFPVLGVASSILISWRIKKYSSGFAVADELKRSSSSRNNDGVNDAQSQSSETVAGSTNKRKC